MTRRLIAWWTGRLYLHPPKRARQIGRRWLVFGLAMFVVYVALFAARVPWAFLLGSGWVIGAGEALAHSMWAAGWEARDRRGPQ